MSLDSILFTNAPFQLTIKSEQNIFAFDIAFAKATNQTENHDHFRNKGRISQKKIVIKTIFKENLLQNVLQLKTKFIELNYDM